MTPPRAASRRYFPTSPFKPPLAPPPPDVFAVRDQVTHDKYGLGRVMSIEDGTSVVIDFRTHRVRILTPYAKLTKLCRSAPGPAFAAIATSTAHSRAGARRRGGGGPSRRG